MENFENQIHNESSLIVNEKIKSFLLETAKWGKFLAIVGFVMMGLLILIAVIMMLVGFPMMNSIPGSSFPIRFIGLIYVVIAVIYYFPVSYLYKFSTQIKTAIPQNDNAVLTDAFQNLKSMFKFFGIFTIVVLSLYGLALVVMIPAAMFFAH